MLVHEDLELEDEDLLLDEEEELDTNPCSHEEQLDSVSVPSLSEASRDSDSVAIVMVGTLQTVLHVMVLPPFFRKP